MVDVKKTQTKLRMENSRNIILRFGLLWLVSLLILLVLSSQITVSPHHNETGSDPLVNLQGLGLEFLGLPSYVSKSFYVHFFHLLVLILLAGQLTLAARQHREEYLRWALATCCLLAVSYSFRLVLLFGAHTKSPFNPQSIEVLEPWVLGCLSLASTTTLLFSGMAAEYPKGQVPYSRILLLVATPILGAKIVVKVLSGNIIASLAPLGAASIAACGICAVSFSKRAKRYGGYLPIVLFAAFGIYGLVHLFEPLSYERTFRFSEFFFVASFVGKSLAFLALVALALVESYSSLETSRDQLKLQKEEYDDLLRATGSGYVRIQGNDLILESLGEEEMLGRKCEPGTTTATQLFSRWDPPDLPEETNSQRFLEWTATVPGSRGEERILSFRARVIKGGQLKAIYHDVSESEFRKQARERLHSLAAEMPTENSILEPMGRIEGILRSDLGTDFSLYLKGPSTGASPSLVFISNEKELSRFPQTIGDNILDPMVERSFLKVTADDTEPANVGVRQLFDLKVSEDLIIVAIRVPFGEEPEHSHQKIRAIAVAVVSARVSPKQRAIVEALEELGPHLLLGIETTFNQRLLEDLDSLWESIGSASQMSDILRIGLSHIADGQIFSRLYVATLDGETFDFESGRSILVSSKGSLDSDLPNVMKRILKTFDPTEPDDARFFVWDSDREPGFTSSWGSIPLKTSAAGLVGILLVKRNGSHINRPLFTYFDGIYLKHLARHIAILITRIEAKQTFQAITNRISHDFKTPVLTIRNKADFLIRNWTVLRTARREDKLSDIKHSASELLVMANRIDAFREITEVEQLVMVGKLVEKWKRELEHMFSQRGATPLYSHTANFEQIPELLCRRGALDRIVQNIIINFAKYGSDREHSRAPLVEGTRSQEHYIVVFRNWGEPIWESEGESIFSEGFRNQEMKKKVVGEGMGLFISRKLARSQLGGDLLLARYGDPVEFHLLLPQSLRASKDPGVH